MVQVKSSVGRVADHLRPWNSRDTTTSITVAEFTKKDRLVLRDIVAVFARSFTSLRFFGSARVSGGTMAILDDMRAASEVDRLALLLAFIEDQVIEMLDWPESRRAELSRGFAAIGFDSMMSVDLQFRVQSELDFAAPSPEDFLQPSAQALAQHLLDAQLLPLDYPVTSSPSIQQLSS
jgi:hypothetical protein